MVIFIALVIAWTPYAVMKLVGAQHARTPDTAHPLRGHAQPPSGTAPDTGNEDAPAWSTLDDRQLTRLLTDSAPRSSTE